MAQSKGIGWIIGLAATAAGYLFLKNSYCAVGGSGSGVICNFFGGPRAGWDTPTTSTTTDNTGQPGTPQTIPASTITPPPIGPVGMPATSFTPEARSAFRGDVSVTPEEIAPLRTAGFTLSGGGHR